MDILEAKHEKELEALRQEMKEKIKKAKKSEKAVIEAQAIQSEFDLKARHREEMEAFEESGTLPADLDLAASATSPEESAADDAKADDEELKGDRKKEKARRKKDKRAQKDKDREEEKASILASGAGIKTARDFEIEELEAQLLAAGLKVKDIPSDGHCLYRAIADQLRGLSLQVAMPSYADCADVQHVDLRILRRIAAEHIRRNRDEFAPFIGFDAESSEFENYCRRVESDTLAEWGGQLEIRALTEALGVTIVVYSAGAAPLVMGDANRDDPVRLSFHRHLFRLGEHYNAVINR